MKNTSITFKEAKKELSKGEPIIFMAGINNKYSGSNTFVILCIFSLLNIYSLFSFFFLLFS